MCVVHAPTGGALSNIIFMNHMTSHVVEISPPWGRDDNHFRNIASIKGVGYERLLQDGDHSDVNVQTVLEVVNRLYKKNEHKADE